MRSVVALGLVLACGCSEAPFGVANRAIIGGATDNDDTSVFLIVAQVPGSKTATLCSGTVISPHVLLTAAHCVSPASVGDNVVFSAYAGVTIDGAKATDLLSVKTVQYDASFDASDPTRGFDIGIVVMNDPLPAKQLAMNRTAITDDLVGKSVRLIGYGQTKPDDPTGATAGTRREVTTVLDSYTTTLARFGVAGATTCFGDSGGPAMMTIDGEEQIVGIVSFGDTMCAQFTDDTRVDAYADGWVQPYLDMYDPGAVTTDGGASGGGEHGGCAVASTRGGSSTPWLAFGLVGLLGLRRRRQKLR